MTNEELITKIKAEIERLKELHKTPTFKGDEYEEGGVNGSQLALDKLLSFLDTLESETTYDTQQYSPRPSVGIEDVARVQFASHAKVFDKKRKAVFDWEQFKEVAGIFYGFGKKDTLESEKPEPYNPVYDEAYLNEKIKKATESWKGVDVDAMLAECRGYDEEKSEKPMNQDGLEEEINRYLEPIHAADIQFEPFTQMTKCARHFAKWGAEHLADARKTSPNDLVKAAEAEEDRVIEEVEKDDRGCPYISSTHVYNAFVRGAKWNREQMMKEAVEGEVSHYATVHYVKTNESQLSARLKQFQDGDKVRIIIVKED